MTGWISPVFVRELALVIVKQRADHADWPTLTGRVELEPGARVCLRALRTAAIRKGRGMCTARVAWTVCETPTWGAHVVHSAYVPLAAGRIGRSP